MSRPEMEVSRQKIREVFQYLEDRHVKTKRIWHFEAEIIKKSDMSVEEAKFYIRHWMKVLWDVKEQSLTNVDDGQKVKTLFERKVDAAVRRVDKYDGWKPQVPGAKAEDAG